MKNRIALLTAVLVAVTAKMGLCSAAATSPGRSPKQPMAGAKFTKIQSSNGTIIASVV
jgi:hypothetical protein